MVKKIFTLAGLLLALTPFFLFPVCDALKSDGSHMGCWYSGILISTMGVLIFLLSSVKKFPILTFIFTSIFALSCWIIPNRIINIPPFSLCANPEHACRASTMPVVGIIVIVILALCVSSFVINFVRGK